MNRTCTMMCSALALVALLFVASCSREEKATIAEPKTSEVHLTALGMKCESCKETIESNFMRLPGVDSVFANHETKDVYVRVDTSQTSYSRLEDLISELGFDYAHDGEDL